MARESTILTMYRWKIDQKRRADSMGRVPETNNREKTSQENRKNHLTTNTIPASGNGISHEVFFRFSREVFFGYFDETNVHF